MVVETLDGATFNTRILPAEVAEDVKGRARVVVCAAGGEDLLGMLGLLEHEKGCECGDC